MSNLDRALFSGVFNIITPSKSAGELDKETMLDDLEGEGETILNLEEDAVIHVTELLASLNNVSRGVSDRTHDEYRR